jgi:hypothetical protein
MRVIVHPLPADMAAGAAQGTPRVSAGQRGAEAGPRVGPPYSRLDAAGPDATVAPTTRHHHQAASATWRRRTTGARALARAAGGQREVAPLDVAGDPDALEDAGGGDVLDTPLPQKVPQKRLRVRPPPRRNVRPQRVTAAAVGGHGPRRAEGEAVVEPPVAGPVGRGDAGGGGRGGEVRGEGGEVDVCEEAGVGAEVKDEGVGGGSGEPEGRDAVEAVELAGEVEDGAAGVVGPGVAVAGEGVEVYSGVSSRGGVIEHGGGGEGEDALEGGGLDGEEGLAVAGVGEGGLVVGVGEDVVAVAVGAEDGEDVGLDGGGDEGVVLHLCSGHRS